ncbi:MAG: hypothetical protein ABJ308_13155 [Halieaceae bacterium]
MKATILTVILAATFAASMATAQNYVYCKAIDNPNGPVYTFENACPVGYYPV